MKAKKILIPECFQDFFKFRHDCNDTMPTSGLMFDNVAGISRDFVAQLIDGGKYCNEQDVADNALVAALAQVENMLLGELARTGVAMNREVEKVEACSKSKRVACSTPGWRGIRVSTGHMQSPFACLRVHTVNVHTVGAQSVTLQIKDERSRVVWSKNVQTVAGGMTTVDVNQDFNTRVVYVGFNQREKPVHETECKRSGPCCMSVKTGRKTMLDVSGWDASFVQTSAATAQGFGITACISLICKKDNLICHFREQLKNVILFTWAMNVFQEAKLTRRMNQTINLTDEQSGEMMAFYNQQIHESMSSAMMQIKHELLKDKTCFGCCDVPLSWVAATS